MELSSLFFHPANVFMNAAPTIPTDPKYLKLTTPKNTVSTTFVKNILKTPRFAEQIAAKQATIAARGA